MGKWIAVAIGIVAILLGAWLLLACVGDFLVVVKGAFPLFLIVVGLIAFFAGIGEIKESGEGKKEIHK
jgi:F0F1-type ATP synthase assembly protein I